MDCHCLNRAEFQTNLVICQKYKECNLGFVQPYQCYSSYFEEWSCSGSLVSQVVVLPIDVIGSNLSNVLCYCNSQDMFQTSFPRNSHRIPIRQLSFLKKTV